MTLQMGQRVRLLTALEREGGAVAPAGTIGVVADNEHAPQVYVVDIVVAGTFDYVFAGPGQIEPLGPVLREGAAVRLLVDVDDSAGEVVAAGTSGTVTENVDAPDRYVVDIPSGNDPTRVVVQGRQIEPVGVAEVWEGRGAP